MSRESKFGFFIALILLSLSTELLPAQVGPSPSAEEEVERVERLRFAAMVRADTAELRWLLADELRYTHTTGQLETKQQFLETLGSGRLDYVSIEPEELAVRIYGSTAVVSGRSRMGVGEQRFSIRFLDVYVRRADRWQMVAWQATRLP